MNTATNTDGLHVELNVEGIARDAFASALSWIWQKVDFLLPIITGQWSLQQAVFYGAALAFMARAAFLVLVAVFLISALPGLMSMPTITGTGGAL